MNKGAINIGEKLIGINQPVFIIAEAGVNHNGDFNLAKQLVIESQKAGADCVKFQTFRAEKLVTESSPKVTYQLQVTDPCESQKKMLEGLELTPEQHKELLKLCNEVDIIFLSTPYNFSDIDSLEELGVPAYKLASMHLTELPMIEYVAKKNKPIFLSTGMSTVDEIVAAVQMSRNQGNDNLILLQCTTNYPTPIKDANLLAIRTIREQTDMPVGYSDHTAGIDASVLAVGVGACVIEKHFTLDKNWSGPDHFSSADPKEFAEMVKRIREAEIMLGSGKKTIADSEKANIFGMRRSLVATEFIPKGTKIQLHMIDFKRPAGGLNPNYYYRIIGAIAKTDIQKDQMIIGGDVEWL